MEHEGKKKTEQDEVAKRNAGTEPELPPFWIKVPSTSRPGDFSYMHTQTGRKLRKIPTASTPSAKKKPRLELEQAASASTTASLPEQGQSLEAARAQQLTPATPSTPSLAVASIPQLTPETPSTTALAVARASTSQLTPATPSTPAAATVQANAPQLALATASMPAQASAPQLALATASMSAQASAPKLTPAAPSTPEAEAVGTSAPKSTPTITSTPAAVAQASAPKSTPATTITPAPAAAQASAPKSTPATSSTPSIPAAQTSAPKLIPASISTPAPAAATQASAIILTPATPSTLAPTAAARPSATGSMPATTVQSSVTKVVPAKPSTPATASTAQPITPQLAPAMRSTSATAATAATQTSAPESTPAITATFSVARAADQHVTSGASILPAASAPAPVEAKPELLLPITILGHRVEDFDLDNNQCRFTRIVDGKRFPIGFKSTALLLSSNQAQPYECRNSVEEHDMFAVQLPSGTRFEAASPNLVWDKVFANLGVSAGSKPSGFELFGFARQDLAMRIQAWERVFTMVPFSHAHEAAVEIVAFQRKILNILAEQHPNSPATIAAAEEVLANDAQLFSISWDRDAVTPCIGFTKCGMRFSDAFGAIAYIGFLSPAFALAFAMDKVRRMESIVQPIQTYHQFQWNEIYDLQFGDARQQQQPQPQPFISFCSSLKSRVTLPFQRKSLQGKISDDALVLECEWGLDGFKVSTRDSLLGKSTRSCAHALSLALQSPLLVSSLFQHKQAPHSSDNPAPKSANDSIKWELKGEESVRIEQVRENEFRVSEVSFALINALDAPRIGDIVTLAKGVEKDGFRLGRDMADLQSIKALVFKRSKPLAPRERLPRPTNMFPRILSVLERVPQVGDVLFGFSLTTIWRLEAHHRVPIIKASSTSPRQFSASTPLYAQRYRHTLLALQLAIDEHIRENARVFLCDEPPAGEETSQTSAEEHCKLMAAQDVDAINFPPPREEEEVVEEDWNALLRYVSCDAFYKAKLGEGVLLDGQTVLRDFESKTLGGLPKPLNVLNGRYVLVKDGSKDERWVFVGGEHPAARALTGKFALFSIPTLDEMATAAGAASASRCCWVLSKLGAGSLEEDTPACMLFRNARGDWYLPSPGDGKKATTAWTRHEGISFV